MGPGSPGLPSLGARMERKRVEVPGASVTLGVLVEAVWRACQREDIPAGEFCELYAQWLEQSAEMVRERVREWQKAQG